ncbi:HET-domain-containing [Fusarium albosuccineum]|uniref:HET-domain-containing n=1 Tax=Fusarium albosuccineum TaxID=1237068 RepID=A0A8H4L5R6_9HYPO|nr:HET-domain-containing [Fusarium albosuccineum]
MADTVLCWLGPPDEIMCRAIDIIKLVAHERGERGGDGRDNELQHIFIDLAENIQVKAKSFDYILACGKVPPNVQESLQTHHVLGETEAHELAHSLQSATEIISQSLDTPSRIKPIQYVGVRHIVEAFNIAHCCLIKFGLLVSHTDAEDGQHVLESLTGTTETLHKKLQDLVQSIASSRKSANSDWIHEHALIYDENKSALNDDRTGLGAVCRFFCVPFWERVWIMQEIVLAHNPMFICGTRTLSLATLDSFAAWMEWLLEGPDDIPCEYLKGTDAMFELVFTSNYKFLHLLFQARRDIDRPPGSCLRGRKAEVMGGMSRRSIWWAVHFLKATNPKDYFYGLLGIGGVNLDPDYSESKSVGAVCRDFTVEYLKLYQLRFSSLYGGALALLTFAGIGPGWHMYPDTPSWAPNFPGMANSDPDTGMIPGTWNRLECDFLFQTSETVRIVGSDMFVAGVILGSVQNAMPIPTGSMKQGRWHASSELITWAVDRAMSRPTYVAGCHALKALDAILRAKWHENFKGPVDRSLNDCSELLLFLRGSFCSDELQGSSDDDLAAFERRAMYIKSLSKDIKVSLET